MSYALGQAKWIPGQISFATTKTGRLPSVQPLIEAGLPYAPYIEHGSFVTGQPDIARYGRDPYRGISGPIGYLGTNGNGIEERADQVQEVVETTVTETIRAALPPTVMVLTGVAIGAASGLAGGLLKKPVLSTFIGAIGGGVLGYVGWRYVLAPEVAPEPASAPTSGLSGVLAVM